MRARETRSTSIYWLVDTRTDVPFYCGKTVYTPEVRLKQHLSTVARSSTSAYIASIFEFIKITLVELVAPDCDWVAAERHWIKELRALNPNALNKADGGQGISGLPRSAETKAKISVKQKGKIISDECRAKISAIQTGRPITDVVKAKISAALMGRSRPLEVIEKIRAAQKGRPLSPEHREALRGHQNFLGRKHLPEAKERLRLAAVAQHADRRARQGAICV